MPFCKNYSERDGRFAKNFDLEISRKFREKDIMLGYHEGDSLDNIINMIIYIFKWELWKIRNKTKYNGINLGLIN